MIGRLGTNRTHSGHRRKVTTRVPTLGPPAYSGRHEGETVLVLGNGPTLRTRRDALLRFIDDERPLVLGANHIAPFVHPHYHAFTNRKRFWDYAHTIDGSKSHVLLSPYFTLELIRLRWNGPYEEIPYVADNDATFDISDGVIQAGCRTISVLLIGVATVMGAGRILVAGLDGFDLGPEKRPATSKGQFHAETRILKDGPTPAEVDRYTRRFLDEIQTYLRRVGRTPFALITPTTYTDHYRTGVLQES